MFKIEKVTERTVMVSTDSSNAGAIALNNFIIAIDPTIFPKWAEEFRKDVEKRFNKPVKYLLVTHYHSDHTIGTGPFKDVTILGTPYLKKEIEKRINSGEYKNIVKQWKGTRPGAEDLPDEIEVIPPHETFTEDYIIKDDDLRVEIYATGGHTKGSSIAYFPNEKVLFPGDLIFAKMFPWAGDPGCNPDLWIKAFEKMLTFDFDFLIPGHGVLVGKEEVEKQLDFFKKLKMSILNAMKEEKDFKEIELPELYKPFRQEMYLRSLDHWYKFYSNKK